MASFKVVIPARYGSSRFPGKPLQLLADKPMLQHVYERAVRSGAEEVWVATDDVRIQACAKHFGARVMLTSSDHQSGTERVAEVAEQLKWSAETLVVNVQGDEPLVPVDFIGQVAVNLEAAHTAGVATLAVPFEDECEIFDPNVVKVVTDAFGFALYFSRAAIPWDRERYPNQMGQPRSTFSFKVLRHIGMYGYRVGFLQRYLKDMPITVLEAVEALEQLRALYYGVKIHVGIVNQAPPKGVDTPEDVFRVATLLQA